MADRKVTEAATRCTCSEIGGDPLCPMHDNGGHDDLVGMVSAGDAGRHDLDAHDPGVARQASRLDLPAAIAPRTPPIVSELWILPRPRKDCYVGSFPLHFEQKLWRLLGEPEKVLHPFGGLSEIGDSVDLNASTTPTWVGDAHDLHWIEDDTYDLVILDPPYSDDEAAWLYSTPPLKPGKFQAEACRVTRPGGYVALYHRHQPKRPADGWLLTHRVVVLTRTGHAPRVCFVYQKPEA